MLIVSQDKTIVYNTHSTNIIKTYDVGNGKHYVCTDKWESLGEYESSEAAQKALLKIIKAYSHGQKTFYMP